MAITTDTGAKKIAGSDNWRDIFDDHNETVDAYDANIANITDGLAIMANGNTHAAIAAGQAVYVRNHSTLAAGLYWANTAIATNATLSTSNLTADASGGLNKLKGDINSLNSNITNTGAWYELMGSKNANGDYSLGDSYENYKSIVVMLFGSSNSISSGIFPTTMLIGAGYKPTISSGSDKVTVTFKSTTTVTVSNLTGSVRIYGLK